MTKFFYLIFCLFFSFFSFSQINANKIVEKAYTKLKSMTSEIDVFDYNYSQRSIIDTSGVVASSVFFNGQLEHNIKNSSETLIFTDTIYKSLNSFNNKKVLYLENEFYWLTKNIEPIASLGSHLPKFFPTFYSESMFEDLDFIISDETNDSTYVILTKEKEKSIEKLRNLGYFQEKIFINKITYKIERIIMKCRKNNANASDTANLFYDITYNCLEDSIYPNKLLILHPKYQLGKDQNYKFYIYDFFEINLKPNNIRNNKLILLPQRTMMRELEFFRKISNQNEIIDIEKIFKI